MAKKITKRTRNFATIVYPDSENTPADWQDILRKTHVQAFAILHDKDVDAVGEKKKAHYHVMVMFDSVKTEVQAIELFNLIGGVGCEFINSYKGYARYLCHLDDYEKHKYSTADVISFAGADYINAIELPNYDVDLLDEILEFCDKNQVYSFAELVRFSRKNQRDWFRFLTKGRTIFITEYLKSSMWTDKRYSMQIEEE